MLRIEHTTRLWALLLLVAALFVVTGCKKVSGSGDSQDLGATGGDAYVDPDDTYQIKDAPMRGDADALVTIVAFSEFQCPFCARALPTIDEVLDTHGSDVRVFFKDYPLPFHNEAGPAAEAAHAAGKQGKFWEYHDLLFENQKTLGDEKYVELAEKLNLDIDQFNEDRESDEIKAIVADSLKLAGDLQVRGTPNFFINGANIRGAQPAAAFNKLIEQEKEAMQKLIDEGQSKEDALAARIKENKSAPEPEQKPNARPEPDPEDVLYVPVDESPIRGNENALVTLVLFSDFECPFCKRVEPTIDALLETYGDDLRVVWKHNPLPFHKRAEPASRAAYAAQQQGKFWEYHELIFENQKELSDDDLIGYAEDLGLDMDKFREDMESDAAKAQIKKDQALATRTKAQGTPHSFINGRRVRGAQPEAAFKKIIDEELEKAKETLSAADQKKGAYEKLQEKANKGEAKMIVPEGGDAPQKAEPAKPVDIPVADNVPSRGPEDAPVTLVEYTDFECPFCGRFAKSLDEVLKDDEVASKVRVVVKQFPLGFHKNAHLASQASLAAHAQGKFWEYHDLLWDNQNALDRASLERYAEEVGLDTDAFKKALDEGTYKDQVDAEFKEGQGFGVSGTPTWFINGVKESGALPPEAIKEKLLDAVDSDD